MNQEVRAEAAAQLLGAYAGRKPVDPLIVTFPGLDLADAYAIQMLQVQDWTGNGRAIRGHKVGLTSAAMQRQMGVSQPDCGHLTDGMFHTDGVPIQIDQFIQPRVEPEIAFVLGRDLAGPGVTAAQAAAAVDFVLPALEIIDSRIRDWRISLIDTVADNASSAGVVLGSTPARLHGLDLARAGCLLIKNGRIADTGAGGAVLGNPLTALIWLANDAGSRGITLRAGDVILPGSITAAIPVSAGDTVTADFAGLGPVTATFAGATA